MDAAAISASYDTLKGIHNRNAFSYESACQEVRILDTDLMNLYRNKNLSPDQVIQRAILEGLLRDAKFKMHNAFNTYNDSSLALDALRREWVALQPPRSPPPPSRRNAIKQEQ